MTTGVHVGGFSRDAVEELSARKGEPAWMRERRLESWRVYDDTPMPTRRDEEWRRTDIGRLQLSSLVPRVEASTADVESPLRLEGLAAGGLLVHNNGQTVHRELAENLRAQHVLLCSLDDAVRDHPALVQQYLVSRGVEPTAGKFAALNGAFWSGGTFVYVPRHVDVATPIRTLYGLTSGRSAIFPHTIIVLEEGARLTYVEEYTSTPSNDGQSLSCGVVEAFVAQGAQLTHVTLQEYVGDAFDVNTQRATLDRDSRTDWLVIGLGDGTTKSNIDVALTGPGAATQMLGILWGYGRQHTDYHTLQDHQAPNCSSDLLYKAALTDDAVSVFSGRIRVAKGAHRTDSYQANRTVILSDRAAAFPSPNLEIEANDVRCTHGASVGKVDADQLFYLMSRGLSREVAEKVIVGGFFEEVLQREPAAGIRDNLRELIQRKMEARA